MQSSKQSDFERDFERDSARNAKMLSNPTTLVRAPAPNANAGAALRVLPNTKTRARAVISSAKWLRSTPEQRFRAATVATERGRAMISSAKHALCGVFECCRRGFPPFSTFSSQFERGFRAPSGLAARSSSAFEPLVAAERGQAVISRAKHAVCDAFECCWRD